MRRKAFFAVLLVLLVFAGLSLFLYMNSLTFKVQKAVWGKDCSVRAAVIYKDTVWTFNNKKTPLMSVFKYFVAIPVLNKLKDEKKALDELILVEENMINKETYSPMLKKYSLPFEISIKELIRYMVSESDNNATDILINYIGGMQKLRGYLQWHWLNDIDIYANEDLMTKNIYAQYLNIATPLSVIETMQLFRENRSSIYIAHPLQKYKKAFLSDEHRKFLDKIMIETVTGEDKIKAGLPKDTVFGHKTGMSSRKPDGVRITENDAGFVILPNGETYYIAVFVAESKMSDSENHAIAAQISEIVYKHIMAKCSK